MRHEAFSTFENNYVLIIADEFKLPSTFVLVFVERERDFNLDCKLIRLLN